MGRRLAIAVFAVACVSAGVFFWLREPANNAVAEQVDFPISVGARHNFVTSADCESCHPDQHQSWHATYHRTMTQMAAPDTVVAPFDGVKLSDYRQTAELERRGDEFWVRMISHEPLLETGVGENLDYLPRVERQVVMTTGSHHFQAYWTKENEDSELWLFPWRYHIPSQRWIHRRDVFLQPPIDQPRIHHKIWNAECIDCHSTGGRPGFDVANTQYETEAAELGISCEACHGPGQEHVELATSLADRGKGADPANWQIVNPANVDAKTSTQICGQCHSDSYHLHDDHLQVGKRYLPGEDFNASLKLTELGINSDPAYWADGVCRAGGREFNALPRSACHLEGAMTCLSCHSMHQSDPDDQLIAGMNSNEACFQCHDSYRDNLAEHTHHPVDSTGSLCYNCHMPHTSFALLKAIRSHYIGSPKASKIVPDGQPNACNLCHLDKTLAWTAEQLSDWYGQPSVSLSQDEQNVAASLLWALKGDGAQRVVTAWHLGWEPALEASGKEWVAPHLAQLLGDDYPAVRWVAEESIRKQPGFEGFEYRYNAPITQRLRAVDQAVSIWSTTSNHSETRPDAEQLLLTPSGRVKRSEVNRLLRQQDKRMVGILE